MGLFLSLNKDEFTPDKIKEYNKAAIEEYGNDESGKGALLMQEEIIGRVEEIEEDNINIVIDNSKYGYISCGVELTSQDLLELIEIAVKKLNKFKTVLEGLK